MTAHQNCVGSPDDIWAPKLDGANLCDFNFRLREVQKVQYQHDKLLKSLIFTEENSLKVNVSPLLVSVIIPVFNDSKPLKSCLAALESQTYPRSLYEVIVVDNGSDEDIEGVVSQFGQALIAYESCPGSYAARNKGISLSKGNVIAFTDADCIPALDWIEKGVASLQREPSCGLMAGKIEVFFKNQTQPTAVELYESIKAFPQKEYIEKYRFGATANLWTFRSVIDDVDVFDHTLKSGGDIEWGKRVFTAGYKQIYVDDVCVAHPARSSLDQLYKKVVRLVGGEYDRKRKKGYSCKKFIIDLAKDVKPPLKSIYSIILDKRISKIHQNITVICLTVILQYIKAFERIRLQLGGTSQRS